MIARTLASLSIFTHSHALVQQSCRGNAFTRRRLERASKFSSAQRLDQLLLFSYNHCCVCECILEHLKRINNRICPGAIPSLLRSPFHPRSPARGGGGASAFSPVGMGSPRAGTRRQVGWGSVGSPDSVSSAHMEPRALLKEKREVDAKEVTGENADAVPVRLPSPAPAFDAAAFVCPVGEGSVTSESELLPAPEPQPVRQGTISPQNDLVVKAPLAGVVEQIVVPEPRGARTQGGSNAGDEDWLINSARQRSLAMQQQPAINQQQQQQADRTLSNTVATPSQPKSFIQVPYYLFLLPRNFPQPPPLPCPTSALCPKRNLVQNSKQQPPHVSQQLRHPPRTKTSLRNYRVNLASETWNKMFSSLHDVSCSSNVCRGAPSGLQSCAWR